MSNAKKATLLDMENVEAKGTKWFWKDRFVANAINMLVGNQDVGKSALSLYIAAKVVAGGKWPLLPEEEVETGSVIILSSEDNLESTIKPRIEALKGELSPKEGNKIYTVAGFTEQGPGGVKDIPMLFNLTKDLDVLYDAIQQAGNVRLVVIDPITDYATGKKENSNFEIREYLQPIRLLAECTNVTILGLSHLNKDSQKAAAHRTLGSVAWTSFPRSAWLVEKDPDDPERRCLLRIKCNCAVKPLNMAFRFRSVPVTIKGKTDGYPVCDFEDSPLSMTADEILNMDIRRRKQTQVSEAQDWLEDYLSSGPRLTTDIYPAATKVGISNRTLRRAANKLNIEPEPIRSREGKVIANRWALLG